MNHSHPFANCAEHSRSIPLTLLFLALVVSRPAVAQDTLWTRAYGSTEEEIGAAAIQTPEQGFIAAGMQMSAFGPKPQIYFIKTDADGNTLWHRTYGGVESESARDLGLAPDGGYLLAGQTTSFGAGQQDLYMLRTNSDGDSLWSHTYGGADADEGSALAVVADGYLIAGSTRSFGPGSISGYLVRTDLAGDSLWTRAYGGNGADSFNAIASCRDGCFILTGTTTSFGAGGSNLYLLKIDSTGTPLWSQAYGGDGDESGHAVVETADGGYAVAGSADLLGNGDLDFYLIKTDSDGNLLWSRTYGGASSDIANSLAKTPDNGYLLLGSTLSYGDGGDLYLIKTDALGDTLWSRRYGGTDFDAGYSISTTTRGNYIIGGATRSFGHGGDDLYLLRFVMPHLFSFELFPDTTEVMAGGSLGFVGCVTNFSLSTESTQVWTSVRTPLGLEQKRLGPLNVVIGTDYTWCDHEEDRVPQSAPFGGPYTYYGYVGVYPDTIYAQDQFDFSVTHGVE